MAVSDEPAWRNTPMSRTNANLTADGITWHAMAADQVVSRLTTNIERGLDAGEASSRLQKYGPNRLPEGKKRGPFMRFLSQFNNILVYVLLGAGFVKLMLNLWVDASIIFGVVILMRCSASFRRARPRRHWSRSATCCPQRPAHCAAARRA